MRYIFIIHAADIFRREIKKHLSGSGSDAVFDTGYTGYYVRLGHGANTLSLYLGDEEPKIVKGQKIKLILETE